MQILGKPNYERVVAMSLGKSATRVVTGLLSFVCAGTMLAGPTSSGGGKAVVCFNDQNEIASARLLDTYEGASVFGDVHADPTQTQSTYLELAKQRLAKTGYSLLIPNTPSVSEAIDHVARTFRFLEPGSDLEVINDSLEFVIPQGCKVVQAAMFVDKQNIVVQRVVWNAFSNLDKAGLIVHEAVYWLDRLIGKKEDSRRSRRVVSLVLGKTWAFEDVGADLPKTYVLCQSQNFHDTEPSTVFAVYPSSEGLVNVQFFAINGDLLLSRSKTVTTTDFPFLRPADLGANVGSRSNLESLYEPGHEIRLNRTPEIDEQGQVTDTVLTISVKKDSYPAWSIKKQVISCLPFSG